MNVVQHLRDCTGAPCECDADPNRFEKWTPPYCANDAPDLKCPRCKSKSVCVREKDVYFEGEVEAYCSECHANLEVQAAVEVTFSDPELVE